MAKTTVPPAIATSVQRMIAQQAHLTFPHAAVEDLLRRNGSRLLYRLIERGPDNDTVTRDIVDGARRIAGQRSSVV